MVFFVCDFTLKLRLTRMYPPNSWRKEKRENETGKRFFQGFFRQCGNWRSPWHRDQLRFSVRRMDRKRRNLQGRVRFGKTTLSFVITLRYFLYASVRGRTPIEPVGSNFWGFLAYGCIKKKFYQTEEIMSRHIFACFPYGDPRSRRCRDLCTWTRWGSCFLLVK